jgi:signal transduction histidine kinase
VLLNGSALLLKRAIFNLLDNAIKYSPKIAQITVTVTTSDGLLHIAVADEGEGISRNKLDKVFERFYRIDESRARATGGSGLGLSITQEIVALFGGEISVESEVGKGSAFTISLPTV